MRLRFYSIKAASRPPPETTAMQITLRHPLSVLTAKVSPVNLVRISLLFSKIIIHLQTVLLTPLLIKERLCPVGVLELAK